MLTFAQHSGFGNQIQGLLAAIFLSAASRQTLLVPPLLTFSADGVRSAALNLEDPLTSDYWQRMPGCINGSLDGRKEALLMRAEEQVAMACACMRNESCLHKRSVIRFNLHCHMVTRHNLCRSGKLAIDADPQLLPHGHRASRARPRWTKQLDVDLRSWRAAHPRAMTAARLPGADQIYDLSQFDTRSRQCSDGQVCDRMDATLLNSQVASAGPWCDDGVTMPSCEATLPQLRLRNDTSSPWRHTTCLGPLNDYFQQASPPLRRCAAQEPLAETLDRFGLPLRDELRAWIDAHLPRPCALCVYVRFRDKELLRGNLSFGLARAVEAEYAAWLGGHVGIINGTLAGGIEVVSGCSPLHACLQDLSQPQKRLSGWWGRRRQRETPAEREMRFGLAARLETHTRGDAALRQLAATLQLDEELSAIVFDQVRCARCEAITSRNTQSSFWQQIERLHRRFAAGTAFQKGGLAKDDEHGVEQAKAETTTARRRVGEDIMAGEAAAALTSEAADSAANSAERSDRRSARQAIDAMWRAWVSDEGVALSLMECTLPEGNGYHTDLDACMRRFQRGEGAAGSVLQWRVPSAIFLGGREDNGNRCSGLPSKEAIGACQRRPAGVEGERVVPRHGTAVGLVFGSGATRRAAFAHDAWGEGKATTRSSRHPPCGNASASSAAAYAAARLRHFHARRGSFSAFVRAGGQTNCWHERWEGALGRQRAYVEALAAALEAVPPNAPPLWARGGFGKESETSFCFLYNQVLLDWQPRHIRAIFYANDSLTPQLLRRGAGTNETPPGLALAARLLSTGDTAEDAARRSQSEAERALEVAKKVRSLLALTAKASLPIVQYRVSSECFDAGSTTRRVAKGAPTPSDRDRDFPFALVTA